MGRGWVEGAGYAMLCAIWGSTWLVILLGLEGVSPFLGAALRFTVATVVLLPIAFAFRRPFPKGRTELLLVAFVGTVLFGADYGLIYWGEASGVSSGLSAVLFATYTFQTAIIAHVLVPEERLTIPRVGGIAMGFVGLGVIFRGQLSTAGLALLFPMVAIVLSAACASVTSVAMKRWGHNLDPMSFTGEAMGVGAIVLLGTSVLAGEALAWPSWPVGALSILYLALFGSVATFVTYVWLLKKLPVSTMAFIAMITPLVALFLGFLVRNEQVQPLEAAGTALTLAGVYVSTQIGRARSAEPRAEAPVPVDPPNGRV